MPTWGISALRPMRVSWWCVVLPALLLNYFGQGALILHHGGDSSNPFYDLAPQWALYPMIFLAACATVIASQAVISGAFSLTRQAINLGQLPRMRVLQTSSEEAGQVYVPGINAIFLFGAVGLVIGFGSADRLAGAYGVGVASTMAITTVLLFFVAIERWRWSIALAAMICAPFLVVDLSFLGANAFKIPHGGWFPLTVGLARLPAHVHLEARTRGSRPAAVARDAADRGFPQEPFRETGGTRSGYRDFSQRKVGGRADHAAPSHRTQPSFASAGGTAACFNRRCAARSCH